MKSFLFRTFLAFALSASSNIYAIMEYGKTNDDILVDYASPTYSIDTSVAKVANCSSVYLGNGWFITANHVQVALNGIISQNGTTAKVTYIDSSLNTDFGVDLKLFYSSDVSGMDYLAAAAVNASACSLASGSARVVTNGKGRIETSAVDDTLVPWGTSATSAARATDSSIYTKTTIESVDYFVALATTQSPNTIALLEGDSGGGIFDNFMGSKYLVGIASGVNNSASGSSTTAKFGTTVSDSTYSLFINLGDYADSINSTIANPPPVPEPSEVASIFGVLAFCAALAFRAKK